MTWIEAVIAALSALGVKFAVLVASAVGGFLSLRFFDGEKLEDGTFKPLSTSQKWGIAASGTGLGVFLAGFAVEVFALTDTSGRVEVGLGVLIALFGMSLAASVVKALREVSLGAVVESWLKRR